MSRLKASFEMRHKRADGSLIYAEKSRRFGIFKKYDTWRSAYCNSHRNNKLWLSFRDGRINPFVLIYALVLKIKRG